MQLLCELRICSTESVEDLSLISQQACVRENDMLFQLVN
jgi:hypothetical protein